MFRVVFLTVILAMAIVRAASAEPLLKLPDGYQNGRPDAKYGSYTSVFEDEARDLQTRLSHLESKALGLAKLAKEDPIRQSEVVFLLVAHTI